jgi:hypothetical protein
MKSSKPLRFVNIATVLLVTAILLISPVFKSDAGSLTAAYLYLSRIQTNLAGTAGNEVEFVLAIATTQTIPSGGTVTLTFPDADDAQWCRTAGALTVAGVASSVVDLSTTDWAIDAVLPTSGTLAATCTQGSGASSSDKFIITAVGELTAGTTYGVKLTNGSAAGVVGTDDTAGGHDVTAEAKNGTTIDSSTFKINLISNDTVVVSATVSDIPSVTCSISTNTVDLGSLYPGGSYTTGNHTISTNTSTTASGYYWAAYGKGDSSTDAGLYKSSATTKLLASTGSTTIDLTGVNAEGFGMTVSDPDAGDTATVPTDFSNGSAGVFGSLDRTVSGAQLILYQNGAQSSGESATITYGARAGASAPAGSYSESVTFVCGAYY